MSPLKKQTFYREGAKDAKIFKDEAQDFKSFSKRFAFPSCIINFLRGEKNLFAVQSQVEFLFFTERQESFTAKGHKVFLGCSFVALVVESLFVRRWK